MILFSIISKIISLNVNESYLGFSTERVNIVLYISKKQHVAKLLLPFIPNTCQIFVIVSLFKIEHSHLEEL